MLRELFILPFLNVPIYGYGVMLVLACVAGMMLAKRLARRAGLDPERFVDLALIALFAGVVGARLSYVLENFSSYFGEGIGLGEGLGAAINLRRGGLTYYGGFLLATPACLLFAYWKKIPLLRGMDVIAPCLVLGLAIGRIGCFLNGCCWGVVCERPVGISFPYESPAYESHVESGLIKPPSALVKGIDVESGAVVLVPRKDALLNPLTREAALRERSLPVHATQLYSTAAALGICGVCLWAFSRRWKVGRVFALMLVLEGGSRFLIEQLRTNEVLMKIGSVELTYSMVVGLGLVLAGVVMWIGVGFAGDAASKLPDEGDARTDNAR